MPPKDPDTWMWERARAMLEQADRLHQSYRPARPSGRPPSWEPPVDIFETPAEIWVLVALPGVEPDRIRVDIEEAGLLITGERRLPEAFRQAVVHRLEIPHGRFERRVELPAGHYELMASEVVGGCLFLNLAKLN